jgi:hypothetical protein
MILIGILIGLVIYNMGKIEIIYNMGKIEITGVGN